MDILGRVYKLVFYFRTGFMLYLAMLIGVINVLTSTYFLLIDNIPVLAEIFPTFELYGITLVCAGLPIIVAIGWIHMKRIGTYASESNTLQEEYPYNYKLAPGFNIEVLGKVYAILIQLEIKKFKGEKLGEQELKSIKKIQNDLTILIEGGHLGNPPKGTRL